MAPSKSTDPTDLSNLRSVEPINSDQNAPPPTAWEKIRHNFGLLAEVSKNRPIGETLCLKEALIFGKNIKLLLIHKLRIFHYLLKEYLVHFYAVWAHFF